jgi:hypothetical protein
MIIINVFFSLARVNWVQLGVTISQPKTVAVSAVTVEHASSYSVNERRRNETKKITNEYCRYNFISYAKYCTDMCISIYTV